jgi:hypothetical protein
MLRAGLVSDCRSDLTNIASGQESDGTVVIGFLCKAFLVPQTVVGGRIFRRANADGDQFGSSLPGQSCARTSGLRSALPTPLANRRAPFAAVWSYEGQESDEVRKCARYEKFRFQ